MKCKVCGAESGQYVLCRACNEKKKIGEVIKCPECNEWHYKNESCKNNTSQVKPEEKIEVVEKNNTVENINVTENNNVPVDNEKYLYEVKKSLITQKEISYYDAIKKVMPEGYNIFPQINLATFIERTDDARFHNELFRNVDFLITDNDYKPCIIIEINDQSHLTNERKKRDEKVGKICEEAGIPIIKLWTSYGINSDYISKKITDTLASLPVKRICHSKTDKEQPENTNNKTNKGCYIATCVYGSYDCSSVWVLRRFRDEVLSNSILGRAFISTYYKISPIIVRYLGDFKLFKDICKYPLDLMVEYLKNKGFEESPYKD